MPAIGYAVRLLASTLGACLEAFLLVVLLRKRSGALRTGFLATLLAVAAFWHAAGAVALFRRLNVDTAGELRLPPSVGLVLAAMLLPAAALLSLYASFRADQPHTRRFLRVLALAIAAIPIAGALAGGNSAALMLASMAPSSVFAWFIYRYNVLDLHISRRVVFALALGGFFAFYLFLIREIAALLEDIYGSVGLLTEVALIFAATLIWLPLYGWMTRFLSKRTQLYADFSKRLIEDAARILDLQERLQFLAEELARTFALRKVLLLASGEPARRGEFPAGNPDAGPGLLRELEKLVEQERPEVVGAARRAHRQISRLISDSGFNYLFPLWYERHLVGLLLLDSSPRIYLDENEDILLGLSRQISHSIQTCRVIEEKIGLERALARQAHLASLGKAAAAIAHEIRNPLSSVKALAQLMREDPEVGEKHDRDLAYMIHETDRLNRSVEQLLSFSRPLPEPQRDVNLAELLEDMAHVLARQYAGEQIRIERRVEPQLKLKRGDPEVIRQIVLNLALNAVEATGPGGTVLLSAGFKGEDMVFVSVTDTGSGIEAAVRDRIFEPFFTTKQRGTGLGLAIVQKNVHHLGGQVRVESPVREGRGTRVEVTLPAT